MVNIKNILTQVNSPHDLKKLSLGVLPQLCQELRRSIIDTVATKGGHLGANLGTIELTVAIHYVFDLPYDKLVWDVGHQSYAHKILTGRRHNFDTIRQWGGLSGFPKRDESIYDDFGTGHSSTSISAVLGMAVASSHKALMRNHIAVIGDGAMTGGMAFEALNHLGDTDQNVLVILNDNNMSIDPNVGALRHHLSQSKTNTSKSIFEHLNINYQGPIDGHQVIKLVEVLEELKYVTGPRLLHCLTMKGKGFEPAEKSQTRWHAPGKFDSTTGEIKKNTFVTPQPLKYQDVFGKTILELAQLNPYIVGVSPAMLSGGSLSIMKETMPDRVFDVGIAEQHAVTFSAGMATQGLTVFCNIYSSFLQRAYDQVIHDVCLQKLPVVFCIDRAGLVGSDGPTHHGLYDIAFLRCIPNMIVAAPINEIELRNLMFTAQLSKIQENHKAFAIRYPRGEGRLVNWQQPFEEIAIGRGQILKEGHQIIILSIGTIGNVAAEAIESLALEGIKIGHFDMRFVSPIDIDLIHHAAQQYEIIITIEDGTLPGGFGSAVSEALHLLNYHNRLVCMGVPNEIIHHGEPHQQFDYCELSSKHIQAQVFSVLDELTYA
jgi:1-deoxy-D-xylulose-5-phosphate synthase